MTPTALTEAQLEAVARFIRAKLVRQPHPSTLWCRAEVTALVALEAAVREALDTPRVAALRPGEMPGEAQR